MSLVCKIVVYTSDENFAKRVKENLGEEKFIIKVFDLFSDVVKSLQEELHDILIVETNFPNEVEGLLKVADNILYGIPIIVACDDKTFKVEEGNNSRFYFINKFANAEEWLSLLKLVINENYLITL
jgi:DNA-binding response OmpR family regulator